MNRYPYLTDYPKDESMWPWGHLAFGYFLYAIYYRYNAHTTPEGFPVVAVAIGSILPDLIDKPLAYWTVILPEGRTLAHSLLFVVPVCLLIIAITSKWGYRTEGQGLVIGFSSHPIADSLVPFANGKLNQLTFLVWPVYPVPDYAASDFYRHWGDLLASIKPLTVMRLLTDFSDVFILEIWFTVAVTALWIHHGVPPFSTFRSKLMRYLRIRY